MKKIIKIAFALFLVAGVSMNAQNALKSGSVTYSMTMPSASEEMAAMGESTTIRYAVPNENNWIKVNLQGIQSNRSGIGARVETIS